MDDKWIDFLLNKAMINLNFEEKEKIKKDLKKFDEELNTLNNFNLNNILPLRELFERKSGELREDKINNNNNNKDKDNEFILKNASQTKNNFILLKLDEEGE